MDGCMLCERESGEGWIHRDELWSVWPLGTTPGWLMLILRRHVEGIWNLTEEEIASLGPILARVSEALRDAVAAERVYVQVYGEAAPHFHGLLIARDGAVPPEHRGANLFVNRAAYDGHPEQAAAVAASVRASLGT